MIVSSLYLFFCLSRDICCVSNHNRLIESFFDLTKKLPPSGHWHPICLFLQIYRQFISFFKCTIRCIVILSLKPALWAKASELTKNTCIAAIRQFPFDLFFPNYLFTDGVTRESRTAWGSVLHLYTTKCSTLANMHRIIYSYVYSQYKKCAWS